MKITDDMVERAARAMYLAWDGPHPDWPIGVNQHGYAQEPYVAKIPSWKWKYERVARAALEAALRHSDS
jgi:hypothetical protein